MITMKKSPTEVLRSIVRGNAGALRQVADQLDAEQSAKVKAAEAEAGRRSIAEAKVEDGMPAAIEAAIEDSVDLDQQALRNEAERVVRRQLQIKYGLVPASAFSGPVRVTAEGVARERRRLEAAAPVPWDPAKRSASALRSEQAQGAAQARELPKVLSHAEAEELTAAKRRQAEERRQRQIADRKRAHGVAGYRDEKAPS